MFIILIVAQTFDKMRPLNFLTCMIIGASAVIAVSIVKLVYKLVKEDPSFTAYKKLSEFAKNQNAKKTNITIGKKTQLDAASKEFITAFKAFYFIVSKKYIGQFGSLLDLIWIYISTLEEAIPYRYDVHDCRDHDITYTIYLRDSMDVFDSY